MVELKFAAPLEQFATVQIGLKEGIVSPDGQGLVPWTLTFSVGG